MSVLKQLWEGWKKFGEWFGHIMSTILLSVIYIIIITPFAICYKIFNKQFFRFNSEYSTYWIQRNNQPPTIENYKRQY